MRATILASVVLTATACTGDPSEDTSPDPSNSSASSQSPTEPPDDTANPEPTNAATAPPSPESTAVSTTASSTDPATDEPTSTPTAPLPRFDPSREEIYTSGSGSRRIGQCWEIMEGGICSLTSNTTGLIGADETQFALLNEGAPNGFAACSERDAWVLELQWRDLERGRFVCVNARDRRGVLRIDEMPDLEVSEPEFAITWQSWRAKIED